MGSAGDVGVVGGMGSAGGVGVVGRRSRWRG